MEKFGYGWVKVHFKVSAVLKKRLLERGADPNRLSDTPVAIISDHIKPARMVGPFGKRLQKQLRAAHDFLLFFERHATGGITEARTTAIAHFDECYLITVSHHQINFPTFGREISGDGRQAMLPEKALCALFPSAPGGVHKSLVNGPGLSS